MKKKKEKSKLESAKNKAAWGRVASGAVLCIGLVIWVASGGKGRPPGA